MSGEGLSTSKTVTNGGDDGYIQPKPRSHVLFSPFFTFVSSIFLILLKGVGERKTLKSQGRVRRPRF